MPDIKNWLVIGEPKNWRTTFSQPIPLWGLKYIYRKEFDLLSIGDILWLYASNPVGGIIGVGVVKDKYEDNINLIWPDEIQKNEVI